MTEKDDDGVLMYFEIPFNWRRTLRQVFWINVGLLIFVTMALLISIWMGLIYMDQKATVCSILGYVFIVGMYFFIRHVMIRHNKIREPMRVRVKKDSVVFQSSYNKIVQPFENIKRVEVIVDDNMAKLQAWYAKEDEKGNTGWVYALKRSNVEEGKYNYYVKKYWIPSMKLIVKQIKEHNPEVEVSWKDVRKSYQ